MTDFIRRAFSTTTLLNHIFHLFPGHVTTSLLTWYDLAASKNAEFAGNKRATVKSRARENIYHRSNRSVLHSDFTKPPISKKRKKQRFGRIMKSRKLTRLSKKRLRKHHKRGRHTSIAASVITFSPSELKNSEPPRKPFKDKEGYKVISYHSMPSLKKYSKGLKNHASEDIREAPPANQLAHESLLPHKRRFAHTSNKSRFEVEGGKRNLVRRANKTGKSFAPIRNPPNSWNNANVALSKADDVRRDAQHGAQGFGADNKRRLTKYHAHVQRGMSHFFFALFFL